MDSYSLVGRNAIVTGASQGLGRAIATALFRAGASLVICGRTQETLDEAAQTISHARLHETQRLIPLRADVSQPDDVDKVKECALQELGKIQVLVNNAGVYGPIGRIEDVDWKEWTCAVEINLYGPILMCRALLPHLRQQQYGKIIQISGGGATAPKPRFEAYAASKAAVVRFMESLAGDCAQDHIDINSVAPGLLNTRLLGQVLAAGAEAAGENFYRNMAHAHDNGTCDSLDLAAALCVFLASGASDGITGKLISAKWDDYEDWPHHLEELQNGDLYTLRRITGRDRGTNWGDK